RLPVAEVCPGPIHVSPSMERPGKRQEKILRPAKTKSASVQAVCAKTFSTSYRKHLGPFRPAPRVNNI
ncbi:MAG: hypothetical protein QF437_10975, partial [Planctomycetota bacterium]|nr:hypothetical protein [Planctomycetota bacterium]